MTKIEWIECPMCGGDGQIEKEDMNKLAPGLDDVRLKILNELDYTFGNDWPEEKTWGDLTRHCADRIIKIFDTYWNEYWADYGHPHEDE